MVGAVVLSTAACAQQPDLFRPATCGDDTSSGTIRCTGDAELVAFNVGVTAAFAVIRGTAEGRVRSWRDVAEVAGAGALAGAGFALAKQQVGSGRTLLGVGLGFASSSLVENVAEGEHPFAYLRAGLGPADLRVRLPFAMRPGPEAAVEVDPLAAGALVVLPLQGYRPFLRGGVLTYEAPEDRSRAFSRGGTLGQVVFIGAGEPPEARRHEIVHSIQFRQCGATLPYGTAGDIVGWARRTSSSGRVTWDVRTGTGTLGCAVGSTTFPYGSSPLEMEAYSVARPE